jgi:hypothetical protein
MTLAPPGSQINTITGCSPYQLSGVTIRYYPCQDSIENQPPITSIPPQLSL